MVIYYVMEMVMVIVMVMVMVMVMNIMIRRYRDCKASLCEGKRRGGSVLVEN